MFQMTYLGPHHWSVHPMTIWCLIGIIIVVVEVEGNNNAGTQPEQIHLSLGTTETEMVVTWHTIDPIDNMPEVYYGQKSGNLNESVLAETEKFKNIVYTYRALMVRLVPGTVYFYKVGSKQSGWSKQYSFRTLKGGNDWEPTFCVFGDLGTFESGGKTIPKLIQDVDHGLYDVVFHVGDLAYDIDDKHGKRGNKFMREIEPIAARVPYMTCPGNHESAENFSHYDARFSMIGDRHQPQPKLPLHERLNNHYHSMDIGPAHIIMFSTEFYYFDQDNIEPQFKFLEQDLTKANQNRATRPWIITMGHRPMYCYRRWPDKGCSWFSHERMRLRKGAKGLNGNPERQFGLEELFNRHKVDLELYGHDHFYFRMFPTVDWQMPEQKNGNFNFYNNPSAPVHIGTGAAGNTEGLAFINTNQNVAFSKRVHCYTRLTVQDSQHLIVQQIGLDGEIIDNLTIFRDRLHTTDDWKTVTTAKSSMNNFWSNPFNLLSLLPIVMALLIIPFLYVLWLARNRHYQTNQSKATNKKSPKRTTTTTTPTNTSKKRTKGSKQQRKQRRSSSIANSVLENDKLSLEQNSEPVASDDKAKLIKSHHIMTTSDSKIKSSWIQSSSN